MANLLEGGFLSGKKTYIASLVVIVTAVAAYLTGEAGLTETINAIALGGGLGFLRAGVAKG